MRKIVCGIYKIENKLTGKIYIGQSNDIYRRFGEHKVKGKVSRIPLDVAIEKYGPDAFTYDILEVCESDKLNEREAYWICYFSSDIWGYNCNSGGDNQSVGMYNGRAKLTEDEVKKIRISYANRERSRDVYNRWFSDKLSYAYFLSIWEGHFWTHVMPEVYTIENRLYYMKESTLGELSPQAKMTDEEVMRCRERYVNESAREIYDDIKPDVTYSSFQGILWGRYYRHLPIYKKRTSEWIFIDD